MNHVADRVAWDDDLASIGWAARPRVDAPLQCDAVVVGLGASGLAAVEALAERGLDVVGIDAGRVAGAAAGRNGGVLCPGSAFEPGDDPVWHARWMALYRETLAEQQRLLTLLGPDEIHMTGWLNIAGVVGGPRDESEAALEAKELQAHAHETAWLDRMGASVTRYDGRLGRGFIRSDVGMMNPARRALLLAMPLAKRARLIEHTPALAVRPGHVETPGGVIRARHVVVAVDGKLDRLLPQLQPAVRTVRLQMLATAPLPRVLEAGLSAREGYEWAQQDRAGRLLIGGGRDRFDTVDTYDDATTAVVQEWIEAMAERVAGGPVQVTHRWAASVCYTPDRRAVCAEVEDGVVACGAYNGFGNLVGPVAARAAVALALDGTPVPDYFRGME